uniref:Uncharacterized protein n=1 Tax=Anopheles christyi TaxID=43041 RepID=A0A182KIQ9_9DIPT
MTSATSRTETNIGRNRFRVQFVCSRVGTVTRHINTASRLGATTVRVEVSIGQWQIEPKQTGIRKDGFRVLCIARCHNVRVRKREQWTGRIQTNDRVQLAILQLSSIASRMGTQTVSDQVDIVTRRTRRRHKGINHARDNVTDGSDTITGGNIVGRLCSCSPVHCNHVEVSDGEIVLADVCMQSGRLATIPPVNGEARWVGGYKVGVLNGGRIVPLQYLTVGRITACKETENDIRLGREQWFDFTLSLRNIVGIGIDQTQSTGFIRNQLPAIGGVPPNSCTASKTQIAFVAFAMVVAYDRHRDQTTSANRSQLLYRFPITYLTAR